MLRMDKIASIFMLGVTILMFVDFIHLNGKLVFWPAIFGLLYVLQSTLQELFY